VSRRLQFTLVLGWVSLVVLIAILVVAYTLWGGPTVGRPDRAQVSNTLLAAVVIVPPVVAWAWSRWRPKGTLALAAIADHLATKVYNLWEDEAAVRRLNISPLPVRWKAAPADLVEDWQALWRLAHSGAGWPQPTPHTWATDPAELDGQGGELVDKLDRVPTRRLVILGEPGAGKTVLAIRLVLDLLTRRPKGVGTPVPLLVPMASWNPEEQGLRDWLEQRLVADHDWLALPTANGTGKSGARELLDQGLILPVFDGLDEITDTGHGQAITRLNDALGAWPFVLTARMSSYRAAVNPTDRDEVRLIGAAGVELLPLNAATITSYLGGLPGSAAEARWKPVLDIITDNPAAAVAQVLRTPLMTTLARDIYNPLPGEHIDSPPTDSPSDLLGFPDHTAIEQQLFNAFIPAAYRQHNLDRKRSARWNVNQAKKWLEFLAHDLEHRQAGKVDLEWWKLSGAVPRSLDPISVGFISGLAGMLGLPFQMDLGLGFLTAVLTGLIVDNCIQHHQGRRVLLKGLIGGLLGALIAAATAVAMYGAGPGNFHIGAFFATAIMFALAVAPLGRAVSGFVGGFTGLLLEASSHYAAIFQGLGAVSGYPARLVNGLGVGAVAGVAILLVKRDTPAARLRASRLGVLCGLLSGVVMGVVVWIQAGPIGGVIVGLVGAIGGGVAAGLIEAPTPDPAKPATPTTVLRRDRATFFSSILSFGLTVGLISGLALGFSPSIPHGSPYGLRVAFTAGFTNFVAAGLTISFLQACWGSFTLARCWLAATRQLPCRLMTFLVDAHENRGVLLQVGASYRFRHGELQRQIGRDTRYLPPPVRHENTPRAWPGPTNSGK
jgi:hypothetical protein